MSAGALYIHNNSTPQTAQAAGAKITGFSAFGISTLGNQAVTETPASNRLVAGTSGLFMASAQASIETEDISGTSGDDAGNVSIQLAKNGTLITGTKAGGTHADSDGLQSLAIPPIPVRLNKGDYIELFAVSDDASGNDITVRQAQLSLVQIG